MTFLFLVRGIGEFSHAESLAKFAKNKKVKSFFIITREIEPIVKREGFEYEIVKTEKDTERIIDKIGPDALFLCNSKTTKSFIKKVPKSRPLVFGVDSNWLFGQNDKSKVYDWIDCFLVVFPRKIFDLGLEKNGGFYNIQKKYLEKIFCTGFIPSGEKLTQSEKFKTRKELGVKSNEKLIFGYFGEGTTYRAFLTPKLIQAVEILNKEEDKIKLFWGGPKMDLKKEFLIQSNYYVKTKKFSRIAASADLAVLHHGLGTLSKIIHDQIPTICFIPKKTIRKPKTFHHSSSYEIESFEKAGICKSLIYKSKTEELKKLMLELLYNRNTINKMKKSQKKVFVSGEKIAFNKILSMINKIK